MRLSNIRLLVINFDACFKFYKEVLGFKVIWGNEGENYAHFQTGSSGELALFSKDLMAEVVGKKDLPSKANAQDGVVLVFSVDNVDDFYKTKSKGGVKFLNPPEDHPDWGIRTCYARDPDGNLLEFMTELPKF